MGAWSGTAITTWAQRATVVANTDFGRLSDLEALLADAASPELSAGPDDLTLARTAAAGLREAFLRAGDGDAGGSAATLNMVMARLYARPRVTVDDEGWRTYVAGRGGSPTAEYLANAAWGLAQWVGQYGPDRLGRCRASRCRSVYLVRRWAAQRRYCSERCANRMYAAAFRRRQAGLGQPATDERHAPADRPLPAARG
ncbi:CGNR zinc finger domain-containing protein [Micromonospora musae]|uniref:CGNR zinc finger domain-containing protein n=1 Tax=Micromonospora musae TaxID=1894970 RepID=A0ABX9RHN9_9ACTN|nr:CGNR zinc finger domain-containing protein [Micromonospora musae]RKN22305.1 CGNR zinc finger domain-containing protein [Micromonospora musae]